MAQGSQGKILEHRIRKSFFIKLLFSELSTKGNNSNLSHQTIELIKRNTTKLIWHFFIFRHFYRIFQSSQEKEKEKV